MKSMKHKCPQFKNTRIETTNLNSQLKNQKQKIKIYS